MILFSPEFTFIRICSHICNSDLAFARFNTVTSCVLQLAGLHCVTEGTSAAYDSSCVLRSYAPKICIGSFGFVKHRGRHGHCGELVGPTVNPLEVR